MGVDRKNFEIFSCRVSCKVRHGEIFFYKNNEKRKCGGRLGYPNRERYLAGEIFRENRTIFTAEKIVYRKKYAFFMMYLNKYVKFALCTINICNNA